MTNSWWEIQITCEPTLEELILWRLDEFGCRGAASEATPHGYIIKSYSPQIQVQPFALEALSVQLRQDALQAELPLPVVQWSLIEEEDWSSSWKEHWHPQEIGDRFLINPAWLPPPDATDRLIIRLDPGTAFGTGAHATTQLCLESLETHLNTADAELRVADIGCGSGILSIGALLLGAKHAYAVDVDPLAVLATHSNAEMNQINPNQLTVAEGSLDRLIATLSAPVDGIVCNILAEVILRLIPQMSQIAKPSTWAILSGILFNQVPPIANLLDQHGWAVVALRRKQDWCCLEVRRV